jgi:hypothetical protein
MTHTPGPWRVEECGSHYQVECSAPEMSATVAVIMARNPSLTGRADARLIAAAPELLEALVWATNMAEALINLATEAIEARKVSGDPDDEEMMDYHEAQLAKARAAIAKARGGS